MKLSLTLLLAMLALCCYQAEAKATCVALAKEMYLFVMGSKTAFKNEISTYNVTSEVLNAKMTVKKCVDQMPILDRSLIAMTLVNILKKCIMTA